MAEIVLEQLTKVYPDGTRAVSALDLEVGDGELVVFVGPSGCGKTTALRMIAGLEEITAGTVRIGDEIVNELAPRDRDIAMVFQNYALYPQMTAFGNMAFALKLRSFRKEEISPRVHETARLLGLLDQLQKKPRHLSGGQRQRVAMGRAIVREPQAFLMDEPLSNLDAKLRVQMRAEIARIQRDLDVTTVYVTHDQSEAMTLGDRVVVLRNGLLQQVDAPQSLYDRPANLFVAEFIGSPAMNLVKAPLERSDGALFIRLGGRRVRVDPSLAEARPALASFVGRTIVVGIRPEDVEDASFTVAAEDRRLPIDVELREDMGADVFLHFSIEGEAVETDEVKEAAGEEAIEATKGHAPVRGTRFVARVERETTAREGDRMELAIDTTRLHFFDPDSGLAV